MAITKTSCEWGKLALFSLKNSLIRRFTRFLLTDFPIFLPTDSPSLLIWRSLGLKITVKCSVWYLFPDFATAKNSDVFRILSAFLKEKFFTSHEKILDSQPFLPLSPPAIDDISSSFCSHPNQKTVCTVSLYIARLVSSLHKLRLFSLKNYFI